MVLVQKFFCFDLYTTGLLVGWLGLAESITSCIFSILMLENLDGIIRPEDYPTEDIQQIRWAASTMLGIYIAFNVIDLLASGLLIVSTVTRNRLLVIPWIINSFISLVFNGMGIVLTVIISLKSNAPDYSSIIPFTVAAVIVFGIYIYVYIAILSLYQDIRRTTPNSEYSNLIANRNNNTAYPTYTRC